MAACGQATAGGYSWGSVPWRTSRLSLVTPTETRLLNRSSNWSIEFPKLLLKPIAVEERPMLTRIPRLSTVSPHWELPPNEVEPPCTGDGAARISRTRPRRTASACTISGSRARRRLPCCVRSVACSRSAVLRSASLEPRLTEPESSGSSGVDAPRRCISIAPDGEGRETEREREREREREDPKLGHTQLQPPLLSLTVTCDAVGMAVGTQAHRGQSGHSGFRACLVE